MNARYFFVRNRVENKDISIVHCPTEDMLGDNFTKATQDKNFCKFRNLVMNLKKKDDFPSKPDWLWKPFLRFESTGVC